MIIRKIKNIGEIKLPDGFMGFQIDIEGTAQTAEEIQILEGEIVKFHAEPIIVHLDNGVKNVFAKIIMATEPIPKLGELMNMGWEFINEDIVATTCPKFQVKIATLHEQIFTICASNENMAQDDALAAIGDDPSLVDIVGVWVDGKLNMEKENVGSEIIVGKDEATTVHKIVDEIQNLPITETDLTADTIAKVTKEKCDDLVGRGIIVGNQPHKVLMKDLADCRPSEVQKEDAHALMESIIDMAREEQTCDGDCTCLDRVELNPDAIDYVNEAKKFMEGKVVCLPNDPEVLTRFMSILEGDEKNG